MEARLIDCPCRTMGHATERYCRHIGDVGVLCKVPEYTSADDDVSHIYCEKTLENLFVNEVNGFFLQMLVTEHVFPDERAPWILHSYMEIDPYPPTLSSQRQTAGVLSYGRVCASVVRKEVGEVFCRQMKGMFLARMSKRYRNPVGYNGVSYNGQINCTGDELYLSDCVVNLHRITRCGDGYMVIDCSTGETGVGVRVHLRSLPSIYFAMLERQKVMVFVCHSGP